MSCKCKHLEEARNLCVICDSNLFGRSDKRFCNIKCKNKYHSALRKSNQTVSKETMKVLIKNYQILASLFPKEATKYQINKLVLERRGFEFDSISGIEQNKFGLKLKIFNFSWYLTKNNTIIVHFNNKEDSISPFVYKRLERFGPNELAT